MKPIELRPYQRSFIDNLRSQIKNGQRRICGVAPCGAGKTIMMGWMIRETVCRGNRALFFVHRKELIDQTADTFRQLGINFGIIASGVTPNYSAPVQIASVQTLVNRLHSLPEPTLLICDECHHILANSYKRIIDHWHNAILIGVTATPRRTSGANLGDVFSAMVEAPSVAELISLGNLTSFKYFAPINELPPLLKNIHIRRGDYDQRELVSVIASNSKIFGDIVQNYQKYAGGLSAICYAINVKHSKFLADKFVRAGIPAMHVDGDTDHVTRRAAVKAFRNGAVKILCNADLFGEGFDVPNVSAVILARPTASLTLHIQQSMRCMRPDPANPNKIAVIIDHVGNFDKLGYPDTTHNWSLDNKVTEPPPVTHKFCSECRGRVSIAAEVCPFCGFHFVRTPRDVNFTERAATIDQIHQSSDIAPALSIEQIFQVNLRFAERRFMKPAWAAFETLKSAKSYEDCLKIAELANYKKGWAYYQWQELQRKKMLA